VLSRSSEAESEKRSKLELERRLLDAVVNGKGWENVPADLRNRADVPSFKSWLLFDPVKVIAKVKQPILVVTGALDVEFPTPQADRLQALAVARKSSAAAVTRKVIVPGVNHLLVQAKTGETDEYPSLAGAVTAPAVSAAIADWLSGLPVKR
jgi:hypothetical protein